MVQSCLGSRAVNECRMCAELMSLPCHQMISECRMLSSCPWMQVLNKCDKTVEIEANAAAYRLLTAEARKQDAREAEGEASLEEEEEEDVEEEEEDMMDGDDGEVPCLGSAYVIFGPIPNLVIRPITYDCPGLMNLARLLPSSVLTLSSVR